MCDWDPPKWGTYSERMVTARKPHRCCECGVSILPGDRYQVASGVWDDGWESFKTCASCAAWRAACNDHVLTSCGPAFCGLFEWVCEEFYMGQGEDDEDQFYVVVPLGRAA